MRSSIHQYAYENITMKKASQDVLHYCKQLSDAIDENKDIERIVFHPSNTINANIKKIALDLIENAADTTCKSKSTFTGEHLLPFPDVLIGFKHQKKLINCLVLEVKRPTATSKYQAENDHVELLKQMKTSIDFQVKLFIKSPVSFGVLCQGFECFLFKMMLAEDGIYLATQLRKFRLPEDPTSLTDVPRVVESINYAIEQVLAVQQRFKEHTKEATVEAKFVKQSFITKFV
ncbi:hypothetical protein V8B55DRAFT_1566726 [Mucor lusitanicus]|uniref:Uncharacterized protein n=2 Tax=Mucor circinelloides f. lusitanicus TaxID=29924 RepID=A0A162R816_MUCCL|nr:hypothetical protein FB192DRAFT_1343344 [Mucor lusitanicus]OAD09150.1 hypothetical protein MUCCIDRAFT_159306 [Mucor lusitanicus CBS 277.49]